MFVFSLYHSVMNKVAQFKLRTEAAPLKLQPYGAIQSVYYYYYFLNTSGSKDPRG